MSYRYKVSSTWQNKTAWSTMPGIFATEEEARASADLFCDRYPMLTGRAVEESSLEPDTRHDFRLHCDVSLASEAALSDGGGI